MNDRELKQKSEVFQEFIQGLQPVENLPVHLKEAQAYLEYLPEHDSVEVSFFFRPRFWTITDAEGHYTSTPKLRMDFAMSYEEFASSDPSVLKSFMLSQMYAVTEVDIMALPGVVSVEPVFQIQKGFGRSIEAVNTFPILLQRVTT